MHTNKTNIFTNTSRNYKILGAMCLKCMDDLYILANTFVMPEGGTETLGHSGYGKRKLLRRKACDNSSSDTRMHNHKLCTCGSVGIMMDEDSMLHIFTDEIKYVNLVEYIIDARGSDEVLHRHFMSPFANALYSNYSVGRTPFKSIKYKGKDKSKKRSSKFNNKLVKMLGRYDNYQAPNKDYSKGI